MAEFSASTWCCCLVRAEETDAAPQSAYGTIVELSKFPLADVQQRNQQLPGLSKVHNITTPYALITCHSVVPGSTDLSRWKFSETFLGDSVAKMTLEEFVGGVVSCCGKNSFLTPGPTAVCEHGGDECNLGLNFTVLFLNENFKQQYCTRYTSCVKPPSVAISQCEDDVALICQHLPQVPSDINTSAAVSPAISLSGSFEVVVTSSSGKVSQSAVEFQQKEQPPTQSKTQLAQEIVKFERVKVVQCKGCESSSHLEMGAPLVYVSADNHDPVRLIGMLTGGGRALILSSAFQLLQGGYTVIFMSIDIPLSFYGEQAIQPPV